MKTQIIRKITSVCFALAAGVVVARAQSLTWDPGHSGGSGGGGTWDLNTTANWWNGAADAKWTDNSAAGTNTALFSGTAGTVTLNTSLSASNLQFTTSGYTLSGTGTLTLGGGIDASALGSGTTTISTPLALAGPQQSWLVGSGSTLAVNGAITRSPGAAVDFPASGSTSTSLANVNGILGAWATVGVIGGGTAGDWAANDGSGNIITYTGYTAVSSTASSTQTGAGASTQNWVSGDPTGANNYITTLSASANINSLVMQGDFTVNSGVTLTLNSGGLILRGVSRWMLASSSTTSFLTSGSSTGELFVHVPDASSGNNWTLWPLIADGTTPLQLIKDGAGLVKLGDNNSYTGGTIVNAGVLGARDAVAIGLGTPFGTGNVTVNNGGQIQLGTDPGNAFGEYDITNPVTVNGGTIYAWDGFHHLQGGLTVGSGGCTIGATFDNKGDALNKGFAKGIFVDGLLKGTGDLTVQDSGLNTGNAWNSSAVYFTSTGTAAQNTYSGTITVNPFAANGGSYLYLIGTNALANATINLTGDNGPSNGRFGAPTLLFGSGTNLDGIGYATIGGLSGNGDFVLADTLVVQSSSSIGAGFALSVGNNNTSSTYSGVMSGAGSLTKVGTGTLTLYGVNTYTGNTVVNGGVLAVGGSVASANIMVANGATLDVSGASFTLGASQALYGGGTVNGSMNTTSGSKIYAGSDGGYATNAFNNDLSLAAGASVFFDLGTVHNGSNDLITVGGNLTANNNIIHLKAPSTSASLQAADYVLFTSPNPISGSFASAPSWDVQPVNAGNFSIITSGNTVVLHYAAATSPTGGGSATPASVTRNQSVFISVTATNGTGGSVNSVTVDASSIGGSSAVALVAAGGNVWTNTVTVTPDTTAGNKTLVATLTDTVPLTGLVNIPLTVTVANDVWNGAGSDDFWSSNLNWTNKAAPGYVGDSLEFAGSTRLTPSMDNNYTVTAVTFDSTAGSFNIGTANGSTLTLNGSGTISNSSANAETLNVPIADAGGGLTKAGSGAVTLAGANTYTGPTTVSAGTLNLSGTVASTANIGVGSSAGDAMLNISGSLSPYYFLIGNLSGSVGAVYQTGGSVTAAASSGYDNLSVGNIAGAYGYYDATGGSMTANGVCVGGENNNGTSSNFGAPGGSGIMDINGGTVADTGWFVMTRNSSAQTGILNVYSGSLTYAGGGLVCNWGSGQTAVINIMGGSVTSSSVGVGLGSSGNPATLNLDGGLLEATVVGGNFGGTAGQLNFNGGTLQAGTTTTNLLAVTAATIYGGGGTIDNNGNDIAIIHPLVAPAGSGIHGITSFTGGAGYIAPPIVTVVPGAGDTTGSGATAIAQINPATGMVTAIIITCPGVNYTATPTFVVTGGGATTAATITGAAPTPNISGEFTSTGVGLLVLSAANTYTGTTLITNGSTMSLISGGSLSSTNIFVTSGSTFDVSGITYTLGAGQSLSGYGTINGTVAASAGSGIYANGGFGTNTFNNDLTLASGAACYLDLGTVYNGTNDEIVVSGTLTANNNSIHLRAPSNSANLDTTADYVLITAGAISGSFASAPVWDVAPANAGHYAIVTSGNTVTLHYNPAASGPVVTASASPATLLRNQSTLITANVTPGTASISTVTVDLSSLGGSVVSLVQSNSSHIYTNSVTIPATASAGNPSLTVTVTDTASASGSASVPLTVNTSTEVWNGGGANQNWSANLNWVSGFAPGYIGDNVKFAGSVGLAPNMDASYTATGLTFSNNAGSFNIGTANSSTLTLTSGGVVNNSANAQTVNVPVVFAGAETINAASGDITLGQTVDNGGNIITVGGGHNATVSGAVSGNGGFTVGGNSTLTLAGNDTFSGPVTVNAGSLTVPATGTITPTGFLTVGSLGGSKAILNISGGTVSANESASGQFASSLVVGTVTNAAGDIRMSAGSLSVNQQFGLGNGAGGYAGLTMSGGTANIGSFVVVGFNHDNSVMNLAGGTLNVNANLMTIAAGGGLSVGVVNVSNGGILNSTATTGSPYNTTGGVFLGETGNGTLNVFANGSVQLSGRALDFGANATTGHGTLNLLGGTVTTTGVSQGSGTGALNFNGGTLQASAANATFMTGLTSATVYGGGALIDDGGFAVTIAQPLLAPAGYGVSSISLSSGGAGYIDSPIVTISGGSGTGATATAQVDPVSGQVTGIVVTSPGTGYAVSDTLTVTIAGGGGSGAVASAPILVANTSGGLTKSGAGTLTLSGANTYTGNTTINAGTLDLAQAYLNPNSTVTVAGGAVLQLDFAVTNTVAGLVLNGVSQAPGVYNSTTSSPYITGSGSVMVGSVIASNPTNITFSVTGNTLKLTWPGDHLGWILQAQTNGLGTGLSNNWFDVSGSSSATNANITVSPASPSVFYRLRHP